MGNTGRAAIGCGLLLVASAARGQVTLTSVFTGGGEANGTACYRIPGLAVAADGTLVAFAEGRRTATDPGAAGYPIDMIFKRSTDGGRTWSPLGVIASDTRFDYSDPVPVVDGSAGAIHLLFHRWPDAAGLSAVPAGTGTNSLNVLLTSSTDSGVTWSAARDVTPQVKDAAWKGIVIGPGSGIQLRWQADPARNGRLVAAAHLQGTTNFAVFSDDLGLTWGRGALAQTTVGGVNANEAEIVETVDGDVLINARQNAGATRQMFRSSDGGATWREAFTGPAPITTVDGSMLRYSAVRDGDDRNRILFSAPTGSTIGTGNSRTNLTVWTSYDEGRSFINPVQIVSGYSAYSVLAKHADGRIGALYEATGSTLIRYADFGLDVLEPQPTPRALTHYDGFGNTIDRTAGGIGWSGEWIGTATITTATTAAFGGGSSVSFAGHAFPTEPGRMDLVAGQSATRSLATPIDLGVSGTTYLSMLVSRATDTSANDGSREFLDVLLQDSGSTTQAAFGVGSAENVYVTSLGDVVTTAGGVFDLTSRYFLLAKIVSSTTTQPGGFDRIMVKAFKSGVDAIPATDGDLAWTVMGTTTENSSAVLTQLVLSGGASATWSVDEVRVGTSYAAVSPSLAVTTIDVGSGTQTHAQAGYPLLSGSVPVVKTGGGTLVIDRANTLAATLTVQSGRIQLANEAALASGRIVPVVGGTVGLEPGLRTTVAGLDVEAGGLVDVGAGKLTVAVGLPVAGLVAAIHAGRGDGSWRAASGITSTAVAASLAGPNPRTLGWRDNGDGSVTVAYAAAGDTNLDWRLDILDAADFLSAGTFDTGRSAAWSEGDFTADGIVDILDAADVLATGLFDQGDYNGTSAAVGAVAAVPEPAAWPLVAAAVALIAARRHRRRPC
jgi:sialidase-1